jgi:undecaprenyl-diphosphatase
MASAALATALIIIFWKTKYRWLVVAGATLLTFLIGLSRLYLGVHYPSDVLAGWSVSAVWVVLVAVIISHLPLNKGQRTKEV